MLHITGLRHEAIDYTMKTDVVIFACPRELFHPIAMLRGDIGQKLDDDLTILQFDQNRVFRVFDFGHLALLLSFLFEPT